MKLLKLTASAVSDLTGDHLRPKRRADLAGHRRCWSPGPLQIKDRFGAEEPSDALGFPLEARSGPGEGAEGDHPDRVMRPAPHVAPRPHHPPVLERHRLDEPSPGVDLPCLPGIEEEAPVRVAEEQRVESPREPQGAGILGRRQDRLAAPGEDPGGAGGSVRLQELPCDPFPGGAGEVSLRRPL